MSAEEPATPPKKRKLRMLIGFLLLLAAAWLTVVIVMVQPVFFHAGPTKITADPEILKRDVKILSEDFQPRDYLHPQNLDRCAAYIRAELEKTGAVISEQVYDANGRTYRNIVARYGTKGGELTVVGAHYDACGQTPGADDNCSAVAGLLELGRMLGRNPLPYDLELVAYTLEEPPFFRTPAMGSAVHAAGLRLSGAKVRGVVVLEMIGYFDDAWFSQGYPFPILRAFYPSRGNFIAVTGRLDQRGFTRKIKAGMKGATPLPVWSINAPASLPGLDFSDHLNYWDQDWNAVMITDTSFYRNKEYHGAGDTWDRLDYTRTAYVVTGVYEALRRLE